MGAAEHWPSACVALTVHVDGLKGVTPEQARAALSAAARAWSHESIPCTGLQIALAFEAGPGPRSANDGVAVVGAQPDQWCLADADPNRDCTSPSAVASTSVYAKDKDGTILDADIQLNPINISWSVTDTPERDTVDQDLQAALTHELGHLLGFQHPCWSGFGPRFTDDHGQPVPDCYDAPKEVKASVMFPSTEPGDVTKRVLSPEDQRGACEIYPAATAPAACPAPPSSSGCAVGGRPAGSFLPVLVACAPLLLRRARRRPAPR
ncbi:MAG TPA: hypothetical protein VN914_08895 [Polyangia bacterium]|nr:hypothetical protein [Polyangia bacterium]